MSPAATAQFEADLLSKLLDAAERQIRLAARRLALKKVGKRALGALAALLVPDPTITKLIALGMGLWAAWDLLDIAFWILEMRRWLVDKLKALTIEIIEAVQEMPDYDPEDPDWQRRMECILRVFEEALSSLADNTYRESGSLTRERLIRDIERCLNL